MMRPIRKGYTVEFSLRDFGHKDYSVLCTYKYDKSKEKYGVSMWLKNRHINDTYKIDGVGIDKQYISSSKEEIESNVCKIVEYAAGINFFDPYIHQYEYVHKCFNYGYDHFAESGEDNYGNQ